MLLFLTREARFKFSKDDRLTGEGEESRLPSGLLFSVPNRVGETESRVCQYWRGEFATNGGESKGDESPLNMDFYSLSVSSTIRLDKCCLP